MDETALFPDSLLAHGAFMRRLAGALVRDEHAVEDVVQETWHAALSSPPRRAGPLGPWLATLVRNFARRRWRGDLRRLERERAAARREAVPSVASDLERAEMLRSVVEAVLSLDEPYRSTVIHRFYEDLPPREIAARTNVPVETVHTRLRRALARLRATLGGSRGRERHDWRPALLAYAGGNETPLAAAPCALTPLLATPLLLMKIKTLSAAILLVAASFGLYGVFRSVEQPSGSVSEAATSAASQRMETLPAPGPQDALARREAVAVSQPDTRSSGRDADSLPESFDLPIRVVTGRGDPVPDACVELWEIAETLPIREFARRGKGFGYGSAPREPVLRATTNVQGRCVVKVEREPLKVHAEHPAIGRSSDLVWTHHRLYPEKEVTLTLEAPVQVSVLVLQADGQPAAGVWVRASMASAGAKQEIPPSLEPVRTDADGRCGFALSQGFSYSLRASRGSESSMLGRVRTDGPGPREVVLRFPGGLSVSGTLRTPDGQPVAGGIRVWEQQTEAQRKEDPQAAFYTQERKTSERGEFRIDVPAYGNFDLIGSAEGHANSEVVTIAVTEPDPHARGDVRLTRGATIAGVVVREDGTPVVGAFLYASAEGWFWSGLYNEIGPRDLFGERQISATSDAQGAFRFDALHPRAKYTVACMPDRKKPAARLTRKGLVPGAADLRLVITDEHLRTGRIAGTVVSAATGKPVTRFRQWLIHYEEGKGLDSGQRPEVQNERGEFRSQELGFGLSYALAIASDEYGTVLAGPVTISQEEHRFDVRLPDLGRIATRVLEADGTPAVHVEVAIRPLDAIPGSGTWVSRRTDERGRLLWERIPPGRHAVTATRDPAHSAEKECAVRAGETCEIEVRLPER